MHGSGPAQGEINKDESRFHSWIGSLLTGESEHKQLLLWGALRRWQFCVLLKAASLAPLNFPRAAFVSINQIQG